MVVQELTGNLLVHFMQVAEVVVQHLGQKVVKLQELVEQVVVEMEHEQLLKCFLLDLQVLLILVVEQVVLQ
jgi:hypothetical protein